VCWLDTMLRQWKAIADKREWPYTFEEDSSVAIRVRRNQTKVFRGAQVRTPRNRTVGFNVVAYCVKC